MNSASFIRLYAVYEGVTFRGPCSCLGVL